MNKFQHIFIYLGIALLTFMAIALDSTLFWLVAAIGLIAESVWLCKDKSLSDNKFFLLFLSILFFIILFIYSPKIKRELPFRRHRPVPKIIAR